MTRERSITIYAENKSEFEDLLKQNEAAFHLSRQRRSRKSKTYETRSTNNNYERFQKEEEDEDDFDDEYNSLGCDSEYKLVKRQLTLKEEAKKEEDELEDEISKLTIEIQKQNFNTSKILPTSTATSTSATSSPNTDTQLCEVQTRMDTLEEAQPEEENHILIRQISDCFNKENLNKHNDTSCHNTLTKHESDDESDNSFNHRKTSFITQNLTVFDEVLKLIIIGQAKVGKTLLINQLLSKHPNPSLTRYIPSPSLEINKTIKTINSQRVKIELWDTSVSFLTSEIIKTYYKISNGFIFVINACTDMSFIKQHANIIQTTIQKDPSFYIIYNDASIKSIITYDDDNEDMLPDHIRKGIHEIMSQFLITVVICDCSMYALEKDRAFLSYLNSLIRTKSMNKFKSMGYRRTFA